MTTLTGVLPRWFRGVFRSGFMLNGLDLFSGIGGISLALSEWVQPVAYCESDPYAQGVLLSRMADGVLPRAPIWDDIRTLQGNMLPKINIVYGGFPCQDISNAGLRKGLEGERSGLFFEIVRLASEIRPQFIFLENVPAITIRGMERIISEWTALGYDCRWTILSAAELEAPHIRERWWLLGYAECIGCIRAFQSSNNGEKRTGRNKAERSSDRNMFKMGKESRPIFTKEWILQPRPIGMVNGIPYHLERIKGLGNSVVPQCAKEAFKRLMGL